MAGTQAETLTLAAFVPADMPELVELWVQSWKTAMPGIDFEARRGWFADYLIGLRDDGTDIICAFSPHTGRMLGFVTSHPVTRYMEQLAVAEDMRGQGVAKALLEQAQRIARESLSLHVNTQNTRAVRFYEKHGFKRGAESISPRSGLPLMEMMWSAPVATPGGE
jgi:putative acetyltransferase